MSATVIVYWATTLLLSLLYAVSAVTYVAKGTWVRETLGGLGYPVYLVRFLIGVKVAAVIAILARFSPALSDVAYAGMLFHLILSGMAHLGARKPEGATPALVGLVLLAASFSTQNAARTVPSPYAPKLFHHQFQGE
ncbi:DoxX family protein [Asaia siamensis]